MLHDIVLCAEHRHDPVTWVVDAKLHRHRPFQHRVDALVDEPGCGRLQMPDGREDVQNIGAVDL